MNGILIENAEDDIDGDKCGENQKRCRCEGSAEHLGGSLETTMDRARRTKSAHRRVDRGLRRTQRSAWRQVEGDRRRDEAALVVDLYRRLAVGGLGKGGQRHHRFGRRAVGTAAGRAATAIGYG